MRIETRDHGMVVAGKWVESESGERIEATSPATGESQLQNAGHTGLKHHSAVTSAGGRTANRFRGSC